jgi:hypothetical protein
MAMLHSPGRLLLAVAVTSLFAGPAAADGLSKFEQLIRPKIPPGALTYKSAKALGDNGFALEDVVVTPPPEDGAEPKPVNIKSVTVEDADFTAIEKQAPPNHLKLKVQGIEVPAQPAAGVDLKAMAGIDKLSADLGLDYKLDPDKKTFTLTNLELSLNGLGRLELAMAIDGVSPADVGNPDKAMGDASLRSASLVYDDHSLLAKVLPFAAKMQGSDPEAMIAMAKGMLVGMRAGQGPQAQAVIDALASYIEDYKAPKGALKLAFAPPEKITAAAIAAAKSPEDAIKALGLAVSYPGTRKQEAAAPPAATEKAPAGAEKSQAAVDKPPAAAANSSAEKPAADMAAASCTAGARLYVWHEDGWTPATAKEPAKASACLVRLDGGGPEDDITVPTDKLLAWSIDGPGQAIGSCVMGAKVVVESEGTWYPAKIIDKPTAAGNCAVKFKEEDGNGDKEVVSLKRVRSLN